MPEFKPKTQPMPPMKNLLSFIALAAILQLTTYGQGSFVRIENAEFVWNGEPYHFIGTNLWYGMNLGGGSTKDRSRLIRELDRLQQMGLTNLRIMAASEGAENSPYQNQPTLQPAPGQYNESLLKGLDFLLAEMGRRDMKAVVCLSNFWMWSGGFPQYLSWATNTPIPYPDVAGGGSWDAFINYSQSFFTNQQAIGFYHDFLRSIIARKNTINGLRYTQDPTIMSWQLANEPRGYGQVAAYRKWIRKTAKLIQQLDPNHLVCIGAEGDTSTKLSGTDLFKDSKSKYIDYATTHLWIQNWGWFDPQDTSTYRPAVEKAQNYLVGQIKKAEKLRKPLVLEEFGVSRDNGSFATEATADFRDNFYQWVFNYTRQEIDKNSPLKGCNFWSWGGEGRPATPGGFWQEGDDLIGDPAHELQGWYSVYDTDQSTIELIKSYSKGTD